MELTEDIATQIEPEYRDDPMIKESKDLPAFIKRSIDTKRMVGNSIQLPKDDDPPEAWHEKVYSKLGVPKTAEEYKIDRGEAKEWDEDLEKSVREVAHKHGVRPEGLQEMVSSFNSHMAGKMHAMTVTPDQVIEGLKKELGGDYDAKVGQAKEMVGKIDSKIPGFAELLDSTIMVQSTKDGKKIYQANAHPLLVKVLASLAPAFTEDFASNAGKGAGGDDVTALEFEIKDIRSNPDNAKHKLLMAGDQGAQDYLEGLYQKLHKLKGE